MKVLLLASLEPHQMSVFLTALICLTLQKGLLEVLYEIFRLPVPIITEDFTEALLSVGKENSIYVFYNSPDFIVLHYNEPS